MFFAISVAILWVTSPARAEPQALLELFVSKNCPACPAAQENLVELQETDGPFIPLIWVVDYWDYVDGPDPMALPQSAARQRVYADNFSARGPYTPQLVVNGADHVAGNKKRRVRNLLKEQQAAIETRPQTIAINTTETGLRVETITEPSGMLELWILSLAAMERYGLHQPNAVADVRGPYPIGPAIAKIDYECDNRCIAIVQGEGCGPIQAILEFDSDVIKVSVD